MPSGITSATVPTLQYLNSELLGKQDILTPGRGIQITDDTIQLAEGYGLSGTVYVKDVQTGIDGQRSYTSPAGSDNWGTCFGFNLDLSSLDSDSGIAVGANISLTKLIIRTPNNGYGSESIYARIVKNDGTYIDSTNSVSPSASYQDLTFNFPGSGALIPNGTAKVYFISTETSARTSTRVRVLNTNTLPEGTYAYIFTSIDDATNTSWYPVLSATYTAEGTLNETLDYLTNNQNELFSNFDKVRYLDIWNVLNNGTSSLVLANGFYSDSPNSTRVLPENINISLAATNRTSPSQFALYNYDSAITDQPNAYAYFQVHNLASSENSPYAGINIASKCTARTSIKSTTGPALINMQVNGPSAVNFTVQGQAAYLGAANDQIGKFTVNFNGFNVGGFNSYVSLSGCTPFVSDRFNPSAWPDLLDNEFVAKIYVDNKVSSETSSLISWDDTVSAVASEIDNEHIPTNGAVKAYVDEMILSERAKWQEGDNYTLSAAISSAMMGSICTFVRLDQDSANPQEVSGALKIAGVHFQGSGNIYTNGQLSEGGEWLRNIYQEKLIAGAGITISDNNIISASVSAAPIEIADDGGLCSINSQLSIDEEWLSRYLRCTKGYISISDLCNGQFCMTGDGQLNCTGQIELCTNWLDEYAHENGWSTSSATIDVDSGFDISSKNPLQNKVITQWRNGVPSLTWNGTNVGFTIPNGNYQVLLSSPDVSGITLGLNMSGSNPIDIDIPLISKSYVDQALAAKQDALNASVGILISDDSISIDESWLKSYIFDKANSCNWHTGVSTGLIKDSCTGNIGIDVDWLNNHAAECSWGGGTQSDIHFCAHQFNGTGTESDPISLCFADLAGDGIEFNENDNALNVKVGVGLEIDSSQALSINQSYFDSWINDKACGCGWGSDYTPNCIALDPAGGLTFNSCYYGIRLKSGEQGLCLSTDGLSINCTWLCSFIQEVAPSGGVSGGTLSIEAGEGICTRYEGDTTYVSVDEDWIADQICGWHDSNGWPSGGGSISITGGKNISVTNPDSSNPHNYSIAVTNTLDELEEIRFNTDSDGSDWLCIRGDRVINATNWCTYVSATWSDIINAAKGGGGGCTSALDDLISKCTSEVDPFGSHIFFDSDSSSTGIGNYEDTNVLFDTSEPLQTIYRGGYLLYGQCSKIAAVLDDPSCSTSTNGIIPFYLPLDSYSIDRSGSTHSINVLATKAYVGHAIANATGDTNYLVTNAPNVLATKAYVNNMVANISGGDTGDTGDTSDTSDTGDTDVFPELPTIDPTQDGQLVDGACEEDANKAGAGDDKLTSSSNNLIKNDGSNISISTISDSGAGSCNKSNIPTGNGIYINYKSPNGSSYNLVFVPSTNVEGSNQPGYSVGGSKGDSSGGITNVPSGSGIIPPADEEFTVDDFLSLTPISWRNSSSPDSAVDDCFDWIIVSVKNKGLYYIELNSLFSDGGTISPTNLTKLNVDYSYFDTSSLDTTEADIDFKNVYFFTNYEYATLNNRYDVVYAYSNDELPEIDDSQDNAIYVFHLYNGTLYMLNKFLTNDSTYLRNGPICGTYSNLNGSIGGVAYSSTRYTNNGLESPAAPGAYLIVNNAPSVEEARTLASAEESGTSHFSLNYHIVSSSDSSLLNDAIIPYGIGPIYGNPYDENNNSNRGCIVFKNKLIFYANTSSDILQTPPNQNIMYTADGYTFSKAISTNSPLGDNSLIIGSTGRFVAYNQNIIVSLLENPSDTNDNDDYVGHSTLTLYSIDGINWVAQNWSTPIWDITISSDSNTLFYRVRSGSVGLLYQYDLTSLIEALGGSRQVLAAAKSAVGSIVAPITTSASTAQLVSTTELAKVRTDSKQEVTNGFISNSNGFLIGQIKAKNGGKVEVSVTDENGYIMYHAEVEADEGQVDSQWLYMPMNSNFNVEIVESGNYTRELTFFKIG